MKGAFHRFSLALSLSCRFPPSSPSLLALVLALIVSLCVSDIVAIVAVAVACCAVLSGTAKTEIDLFSYQNLE
jgi:hypothetical protein